MTDEETHVLCWKEPRDVYDYDGHPVIAELRARPGEWAVIWEEGVSGRPVDDREGAPYACMHHSHVEASAVDGFQDERFVRVHARWIPEEPKPRVPYSDAERRLINGGGA